jgi:ligand-binding SRPBCC domain-containing protein
VLRIVLTTHVAATARECFDLSLAVDAHTSSMARSGERVVGGVESGVMRSGDSVTWRARHFGVSFTMTSRITEYDAPHRFVDEQVTGPFARWWHEHRFEEIDGTTTMTDVVEFTSPLGVLGRLVDALVLTRYMTRLLMECNRWLSQALT